MQKIAFQVLSCRSSGEKKELSHQDAIQGIKAVRERQKVGLKIEAFEEVVFRLTSCITDTILVSIELLNVILVRRDVRNHLEALK